MDIQQCVAKHLPVVHLNIETGLLVSDRHVGIATIPVHQTFVTRCKEAMEKIGLYLLGGSLYEEGENGVPPVLLDYLSSLCLISYQGQSHAVDFLSYLGLNEADLSTLTGLEFIKTLSQADVAEIVIRINRMMEAEPLSHSETP